MKACTKCGETKPATKKYFKRAGHGTTWDYLRSECKVCTNVTKSKRAVRNYREWMLHLIPAHLGIEKLTCSRCEYNKSVVAMEFHHTNPEEKIKMISALVREVSPWGDNLHRVYDEVDKCEIICSNCHREEHLTEQTI